jgi:hypothetical protein
MNVMMATQVKYQGPRRAFRWGFESTRWTTLASRPRPEAKVKQRPLTTPRSTLCTRQSSPSQQVLGGVDQLPGIPSILPNTLAEPREAGQWGGEPINPLAASLTVPSPPKATTTS